MQLYVPLIISSNSSGSLFANICNVSRNSFTSLSFEQASIAASTSISPFDTLLTHAGHVLLPIHPIDNSETPSAGCQPEQALPEAHR